MLTTRYKIPIENISFEHISELKANKESERELEKMIKILESGELGHFPQLLDHARDKLKQVTLLAFEDQYNKIRTQKVKWW